MHYLILSTPVSAVSCWQPASQEIRQREAATTSWRGPVWASAPLSLRHTDHTREAFQLKPQETNTAANSPSVRQTMNDESYE